MKLAIQLAYRNLTGAGLRTWLNVIVLSFSFVVIIWMNGLMQGWELQAKTDMTDWEIGGGQFWHAGYDPYDPMTLNDSHGPLPEVLNKEIKEGTVVPELMIQGTIYPQGRMRSVVVRGIPPEQTLLILPSSVLHNREGTMPVMMGSMMARSCNLKEGDSFILQWRDANGTFDATEVILTAVFSSNVPSAEAGQVYVSLAKLQEMMSLPGHATILTYTLPETGAKEPEGWEHHSKAELTQQVDQVIQTKSKGLTIFYFVLLLLAMLAIFDTQVLSIFRRQKEIGTYIALGYTRKQVVGLFTVEGTMHAIMAALLAAAYGVPFLMWQAKTGWKMPVDSSQFGMAMAPTLYPVFTAGLVFSTILLVTLTTALVSYWPSRRIGKMNPTDALRGKLQ